MFKLALSAILIILVVHYLYRRFKFVTLYRKTRPIFKKVKKSQIIQGEDETAMFIEDRLRNWREFSREVYLTRYQDVVDIIKKQGRKSPKILDTGCSDAYLFEQLIKSGDVRQYRLYGLDISRKRLSFGKQRFKGVKNITFIWGDAEDMPLPDSEFDVVISHESLEHLINPTRALKEIRRVLKPDGIFILSVPSKHTAFISRINPLTWLEAAISLYFPSILPPFHNLYDPKNQNTVVHRAFACSELRNMLKNWDDIKVITTDFLFEEYLPPKIRKILRDFYTKTKPLNTLGKRILVTAINKK